MRRVAVRVGHTVSKVFTTRFNIRVGVRAASQQGTVGAAGERACELSA